MTFTTLKRTAPVFNRGFFALYEFSDNYVKLGRYIVKSVKKEILLYCFSTSYYKRYVCVYLHAPEMPMRPACLRSTILPLRSAFLKFAFLRAINAGAQNQERVPISAR